MARQRLVSQFSKQMSLVIYVSHRSVFPWLFSTSSHKDGKVQGCREVLEGREHLHVHQLPQLGASQDVASHGGRCWGLRVLCPPPPTPRTHGHPTALVPPTALAAEKPIFCPSRGFFRVAPTGGRWRGVPRQSETEVPRGWLQSRCLPDMQM